MPTVRDTTTTTRGPPEAPRPGFYRTAPTMRSRRAT
jgi:hypothetical protein